MRCWSARARWAKDEARDFHGWFTEGLARRISKKQRCCSEHASPLLERDLLKEDRSIAGSQPVIKPKELS